jgi:hypothetical protein
MTRNLCDMKSAWDSLLLTDIVQLINEVILERKGFDKNNVE